MIFYPDQFVGMSKAEIKTRLGKLLELAGERNPPDYLVDSLFEGSQTASNKSVEDINLKPTEAMANAAKRGLKLRKEHGRGGTEVGVARARDISNRKDLSPSTVKRMKSFFARHEVDLDAPAAKEGNEGYPSAGLIAWLLWGGDPGKTWAESKVEAIDRESGKKNLKSGDNCGTGAGGFKEDNTCATGSAAQGNRQAIEDAVASKDAFEQAWEQAKKDQAREFLGVPIKLTSKKDYLQDGFLDRIKHPSGEEMDREETARTIFESLNEDIVFTEDPNDRAVIAMNEYTKGSTFLNERLRNNEGDEPIEDQIDTEVFDATNPVLIAARQAKSELSQVAKENGIIEMSSDDFEGWLEKWEISDDALAQTKAVEDLGKNIGYAAESFEYLAEKESLTSTMQLYVDDLRESANILKESYNNLAFAEDGVRFGFETNRIGATIAIASHNFDQALEVLKLEKSRGGTVELLDSVTRTPILSNMDAYTEKTGLDYVPVYRTIPLSKPSAGVDFESEALKTYLDADGDGIFTLSSFGSTTTRAETARGFSANAKNAISLKIRAKKGAWLEPYTAFRGEAEVLLPRGQSYRILSKRWVLERNLRRVLQIEAEEISDE